MGSNQRTVSGGQAGLSNALKRLNAAHLWCASMLACVQTPRMAPLRRECNGQTSGLLKLFSRALQAAPAGLPPHLGAVLTTVGSNRWQAL